MSDLISRADAIKAVAEHFSFDDGCSNIYKDIDYYKGIAEHILKNVPSADAEDRLYIKIYADDEPSVKAEKLYQICGETQNREVTEWLKEYFPSADAIHSGGVFVPNMEMPKVCDYCLFHDSEWSWCKAKDKYCGDGKCPLIAVRGERREP